MKIIDSQLFPIKLMICKGVKELIEAKKLLNNSENITKENNEDGFVAYDITLKENNNTVILLFLDKLNIPILAHEATHAANRIFEYIGEEKPSKECYAYVVEWIVKEYITHYKLNK